MAHDALSDAADEHMSESRAAMGGYYDQIDTVICRTANFDSRRTAHHTGGIPKVGFCRHGAHLLLGRLRRLPCELGSVERQMLISERIRVRIDDMDQP
jgi:hypothetical protein